MIDSPANAIVKSLKALSEAKVRRAQQQFVVEGVRALEDALRAGFTPVVCLYSAELLTRTERGAALLRSLKALSGSSLYEASERALQAASYTLHPQGVVASFPFLRWEKPQERATPFLAVICDDIRDPGNMGTLLRTVEASGAHAAWATPGSVDVYNPKVVRAAMGAHFRLPIYPEREWSDIIRTLAGLGVSAERLFCTSADADVAYDEVDWTLPAALVISNEAHGLSAGARQACNAAGRVSIPMAGSTESLNAAIAAAIILFEAARQRRRGGSDG